jgi:hypothetical protein
LQFHLFRPNYSISQYFIISLLQLNQNHYSYNHTHIYSTINGQYHKYIASHLILYMVVPYRLSTYHFSSSFFHDFTPLTIYNGSRNSISKKIFISFNFISRTLIKLFCQFSLKSLNYYSNWYIGVLNTLPD